MDITLLNYIKVLQLECESNVEDEKRKVGPSNG
jgi:hypothetical protein